VLALASLRRAESPFRAARPACRQAGAALYGSQDGCRYSRKPTLNRCIADIGSKQARSLEIMEEAQDTIEPAA